MILIFSFWWSIHQIDGKVMWYLFLRCIILINKTYMLMLIMWYDRINVRPNYVFCKARSHELFNKTRYYLLSIDSFDHTEMSFIISKKWSFISFELLTCWQVATYLRKNRQFKLGRRVINVREIRGRRSGFRRIGSVRTEKTMWIIKSQASS